MINFENGLFARRDHAARGRLCVLYYEPCGFLTAVHTTSPEGMWRWGYLTESEARSSVRGNALFFVLLFFPRAGGFDASRPSQRAYRRIDQQHDRRRARICRYRFASLARAVRSSEGRDVERSRASHFSFTRRRSPR